MNRKGTALITGASSGIGEALARQFARKGFDLVITARREDRLNALATSLADEVDVHVIPCDLGVAGGGSRLIEAVGALGIEIDILVNNAGVAYGEPLTELSEDDIDTLIGLNISALTTLTRHYAVDMAARGHGRILNVASVAGFQPVPSMSLYAASKAFVVSLTEALSEELRGTGVSVTALCPGLTKTEMADTLVQQVEGLPPLVMASADEVAREGYNALMAKEVIRIPGLANKAAVTWAQFQPRWLIRGLGGMFARLKP
ncbi:MAG: SDR family oxidoreductase [Gammaproteobacteria bacterium]|nr:SDR family oxidoreductase [Gammaproteobacteria bacterium]